MVFSDEDTANKSASESTRRFWILVSANKYTKQGDAVKKGWGGLCYHRFYVSPPLRRHLLHPDVCAHVCTRLPHQM